MEPLVQFAVALAAILQGQFPTVTIADVVQTVSSLWQSNPDVAMEDATLDNPELWVVDMGEVLGGEKGVGEEEYTLLVILQQKIDRNNQAEQIRVLGQLASQAGRFMRPLEPSQAFVLPTSYANAVCTKVSRQPARNLAELRKGLFYTELVTTWKIC